MQYESMNNTMFLFILQDKKNRHWPQLVRKAQSITQIACGVNTL